MSTTLDPKTLEGKVVLLDFWATWCGPCIAEFPHLKRLYEQYRDKGLEIVDYCVDSDTEMMYAYLKRNPVPWIVLVKEASRKLDGPLLSSYLRSQEIARRTVARPSWQGRATGCPRTETGKYAG